MHIVRSFELLQSAVRVITAGFYSRVHHEEGSAGFLSFLVNHQTAQKNDMLLWRDKGNESSVAAG